MGRIAPWPLNPCEIACEAGPQSGQRVGRRTIRLRRMRFARGFIASPWMTLSLGQPTQHDDKIGTQLRTTDGSPP